MYIERMRDPLISPKSKLKIININPRRQNRPLKAILMTINKSNPTHQLLLL